MARVWPEEKPEVKMAKERDWHDKSRFERLASVMFPLHSSKETQRQMKELSDREGKRSPMDARLAEQRRSGKAKR
jgi:cytosine/adenosine deaminase-related metal-dependent hydrolase